MTREKLVSILKTFHQRNVTKSSILLMIEDYCKEKNATKDLNKLLEFLNEDEHSIIAYNCYKVASEYFSKKLNVCLLQTSNKLLIY